MNTKIIIAATVAALSLATTAFAGEGGNGPFPSAGAVSTYSAGQVADTGSEQYPAANPRFNLTGLNNATLPENGQNGAVESPSSLPRGAMDGTPGMRYAQSVDRYFAQQGDRRFAQDRRLQTNG